MNFVASIILICFVTTQCENSDDYSDYVHISKHGINEDDCGSLTNPCGTFYFASTTIDTQPSSYNQNDYINEAIIAGFYIMDGQNETEIQLYIDNINTTNINNSYHPCLPKPNLFTHTLPRSRTEYTIVFDDTYIQTMNDWYPLICTQQAIINIIANHSALFDLFSVNVASSHANFVNLIVENFHSDSLSIINTTPYHYNSLSCYNCKFSNISFSCSRSNALSGLFVAGSLDFINVSISNIFISCNSSSSIMALFDFKGISPSYDPIISLSNVNISDIQTSASLFITQYNIITISNCVFYNINTGYDIFGESEASNTQINISDTTLSHLTPVIYRSNTNKNSHAGACTIYIKNVDFLIDNHIEDALIEIDASTSIDYNNVNVYYEYNVTKQCEFKQITHHFVVLFPTFGQIEVACNHPQPFIISYGSSYLQNIVFEINIDEESELYAYAEGLSVGDFNISYLYDVSDGIGFINNFGEDDGLMIIQDVIITPVTFSETMIITHKTIILDNVHVVHDDNVYKPHNYNKLEADIFLWAQIPAASSLSGAISIINCSINGVRETMFKFTNPVETIEFIDTRMQNAEIFIERLVFLSSTTTKIPQFTIRDCVFINSYEKMLILPDIENMIIDSSYFSGLSRYLMIEVDSVENMWLTNNVFRYSDKEILKVIETEYFMQSFSGDYIEQTELRALVADIFLVDHLYVISNDFGYSDSNLSVKYPSLYIKTISSACLSNNTFHNYGLQIGSAPVTSCYKSNMKEYCANHTMQRSDDSCCDKFGEINQELIDKIGYFILDDLSIAPIEGSYDADIALDNIVFEVSENIKEGSIQLPSATNLLLIDTVIKSSNNISFSYAWPECSIICQQIINNSFYTQIQMECNHSLNSETYNETISWYGTKVISHGVSHSLALNPIEEGLYFPGEFMNFNYSILDKFGSVIDDYLYNITVSVTVDSADILYQELISIDDDGFCFYCESGIYVPSITINHIGDTLVLNTIDVENMLIVPDIDIYIAKCPRGYGLDSFGYHCARCADDFYQIIPNSTLECSACNNGGNNAGFKCIGGDNITITQHYWIGIKDVTDINIFENTQNNIISNFCPYGYCCQLHEGCNYLLDQDALCAINRDPNVPLCGACLYGFSETMNSANCMKCDTQTLYLEWLIYSLCSAIIVALYLIVSKSKSIHNKKKTPKQKNINVNNQQYAEIYTLSKRLLSNKRFTLMIMIMFSKVIIYYQQSLSQVLLSGSIVVNVTTLSSFFDLSVTTFWVNNDQQNGNNWCFVKGLTAKYKILSNFILVIMIVTLVIFISYIFKHITYFKNKRKIWIWKSFIALLLLCIGQILSIIFKLLSCQRIGDNNYFVHFYFGNEECYKSTWFSALVGLICVILIFVVLFIKIQRMDLVQRQNENDFLFVFMRPYKPQYYFWEFVILLRRIIVIFIAISFKSNFASLSLIIILCIFLLLQHRAEPFVIHEVNEMESILLFCLIIAISAQLALSSENDYNAAYVILTLLVLIPFILLLYYVCLSIAKEKTIQKYNKTDIFIFKQRIKYFVLSIIVWYARQSSDGKQAVDTKDIDEDEYVMNETQLQTVCEAHVDEDDRFPERDSDSSKSSSLELKDKNSLQIVDYVSASIQLSEIYSNSTTKV